MGGLLYKNFLLFKSELMVMGIIQAVISAVIIMVSPLSTDSTELFIESLLCYFCIFTLSGFFNSGMFAMDEKNSTMSFIISTPNGAKGHIQSKYYTILIVNLLIYFFCLITDTIACGLANSTLCSAASFCVYFFSLSLILNAFSIPFIIRCGSNHAAGIIMGVLSGVFLLMGIYALFGDISMFLVNDMDGLVASLISFLTSGNAMLILSLIPYAALILFYLSYRISLRLFRKGAESYD